MRKFTISEIQKLEMSKNGSELIKELQKIGAIAEEKLCNKCGGFMKVSNFIRFFVF